MANGRLGMQTVEVKEIDALGLKFLEDGIEAGPDQGGEGFVIGSIVGGNLCERRFIITTHMLITAPRIDPKASGPGLVFRRRLAKGEITFAAINAQLDEHPGLERGDEVVGKMQVRRPCPYTVDAGCEVARS